METSKTLQNFSSSLEDFLSQIAVSITELPTPIIIEIINQSVDFAINIPYHKKWKLVEALKGLKGHNCRKN